MNPNLLFAALSGALLALAFPPSNFSILAWIALVPLFISDGRKPPAESGAGRLVSFALRHFRTGLITGFVAHLIIFVWIWDTFEAAGIGPITTLGCWLLLAFILGLYVAVFNALRSLISTEPLKIIGAAVLWVCLEHVRSLILTGFPWALLAHTQASNKLVLQLSAWTGAPGVTFLTVGFNAAVAALIRFPRHWGAPLAIFLLVTLVHVGGYFRLRNASTIAPLSFRVAVLQGNIDQYQKWDDAYERDIRARYAALVEKALPHKPDLFVWPETSLPGWLPNEKRYVDWVKQIVSETKVPHLIGAVTSRLGKDYNALFLVGPDGSIRAEYDKQHLVPFGEYIPFGGFMKRWVPYLGQLGEFGAGDGPKLFSVAVGSGGATTISLTANICYEAIFPELVRKSVNKGADVIVNVTNDGWFLETGAPEQHYVTNIFRAVENGRPVIRSANTGISAVIDPYGQEIAKSTLMVDAVLVGDVTIDQEPSTTLYRRFGPWFVYGCWLGLGWLLIYWLYVTRVKKSDRRPLQKNL